MSKLLNKYSARITQPRSQGASQAMLYGAGLTKNDMQKAQVGIASMWYEGNTCNMHLLELAKHVKKSVQTADLVGLCFNTIGVSDGISMGTEGMRYSLPSREIIADSIETVMRAQWYDACIAIPGCDKNMPGSLIAMGRLNRPALMVYGGTINPGYINHNDKKSIDIVSAFQSYGEYLSGTINENERQAIIQHACPGAGACGGMYTANTMACAIEAMGMSLPYSASTPANDLRKINECHATGKAIRYLLEHDIKPRDIMTRKSFENAIVVVMALGGSTNAILHLLAMAHSVGVSLSLEDFQTFSQRIPLLADFKPSGKFLMADLHQAGGLPAAMKLLFAAGLLHGDCMTVTGQTLSENLKQAPELSNDKVIIHSIDKPLKKSSHLQILHGNLAPEGAVAKITGKEGSFFTGSAMIFDSEENMLEALEQNKIQKGDVIVIRYQGPQGGPGMPEMLKPTSAIMGAGLGKEIALITDGRFSGGSHGFIIGHVSPEAQLGGPIALIQNGDIITIDAENNLIEVKLSEDTLMKRKTTWKPPALKVTQGMLFKYIKTVSSASLGCITDN
jgi:dihydroxy-acid dehydratase